MDRLAALEAFQAVADTGSFSAAGARLGVNTSVVSKRVRDLEDDLGITLFNRTTRSVVLTDDGERALVRAGEVLGAMADLRASARERALNVTGSVRISAPTSFSVEVLAPMLTAFRARHSQVRVQLIANDRRVNPVSEGFDLVIDDSGRAPDGVVARTLAPLTRELVASPALIERMGAPAHPRQLGDWDCVHYTALESGSHWRFEHPDGERARLSVRSVFSSNNGRVMLQAACAGIGAAILPRFLVRESLDDGVLKTLCAPWRVPRLALRALYPRDPRRPLASRALLEFLRERIDAEHPIWD